MKLEKIEPQALRGNPFEMIGRDWFLLTAGDKNGFNTMTAGWGYLGVLWGRPAAIVLVRPSRFTYGFMNGGDTFTISFFGQGFRRELALCGSRSGRDVDKVKETGLTPVFAECGAPYFEEAETVLVCRRRFERELTEADIPEEDRRKYFADGDYHRIYFAEIIEAFERR
ncbi:MAG: flavin reductase [Oscillospiraceae bacterium]|nr:flavin reductase [Oscillospiraceae bacterium]